MSSNSSDKADVISSQTHNITNNEHVAAITLQNLSPCLPLDKELKRGVEDLVDNNLQVRKKKKDEQDQNDLATEILFNSLNKNTRKNGIISKNKLDSSRERNRISAKKSRQRKKAFISTLMEKNVELENENRNLRLQISQLMEQHETLISQLANTSASNGNNLHATHTIASTNTITHDADGASKDYNSNYTNNYTAQPSHHQTYLTAPGASDSAVSSLSLSIESHQSHTTSSESVPQQNLNSVHPATRYHMDNNNNVEVGSGVNAISDAVPPSNVDSSVTSSENNGSGVSTVLKDDDFELVRRVYQSNKAFIVTNTQKVGNPIVFASEFFYSTMGFTSNEVLGSPISLIYGSQTGPKAVKDLEVALSRNQSISAAIATDRKDGKVVLSRLSIHPLHDDKGQVVNIIAVLDIL